MMFESNLDELTDEQLFEINGGNVFYDTFEVVGYYGGRLFATIAKHPGLIIV